MMQKVLIIDFGSQYTQLIARRVRQLRVYCEIHPPRVNTAWVKKFNPQAIILSGGPASVIGDDAPSIDDEILRLHVPVLGICYGLQLLVQKFGGKILPSNNREYGRAAISRTKDLPACPGAALLSRFSPRELFDVWMSHGDRIECLPSDFVSLAHTDHSPYAAIAHTTLPIVGLQFHPEVSHTPRGIEMLEAFLFELGGLTPTWTMESFLAEQTKRIEAQIGDRGRVICGLSGGVDSSVVAALLAKVIGDRLTCIFVDNGLLRRGEVDRVRDVFEHAFDVPLTVVDARRRFLDALQGVTDPERKRKIIGSLFIDVFEEESQRTLDAKFLAQGTLYPDVIESVSAKGPSATIKSHHNVGGLPERMNLQLVEPLRELFKDEVRLLGAELGLPAHICNRQPFPGPGLAIRVAGAVDDQQLEILRHADAIVEEEISAAGFLEKLWQSFAVLLPVRSVGVMGDNRTYEQTLALRCVDSVDGMTADWSRLPYDLLGRISNRVINEVHGVNRVLYDISSKPPATIEWE